MVVNKYARMIVMTMDGIFGVFICECRSKRVFVFSDFKMAECKRCLKVVGKVFLMIKNGPGFMVSHMHSLFNKVWQMSRHRINI